METTIPKGFKKISLPELQLELKEVYKESGKTYVDLAYELGIKSVTTIQNILNPTEDKQVVSDEMLTKFIKHLGVQAFVQWESGERNYFLKK